jgi:hypothetical protein
MAPEGIDPLPVEIQVMTLLPRFLMVLSIILFVFTLSLDKLRSVLQADNPIDATWQLVSNSRFWTSVTYTSAELDWDVCL